MRRKSPVQQWVDSIPQQEQKPAERSTSHDDISVSESVHSIVSPTRTTDTQSGSTTAPFKKEESFCDNSNDDDDNFGNNTVQDDSFQNNTNEDDVFCNNTNDNSEIKKRGDIVKCQDSVESERNDKLMYSCSVDNSLGERVKAPLFRDRSINSEGNSPRHKNALFRDSSLQSDGGNSRASSVESLLESRKVDAEAVLRGVGFGPSPSRQQLARIPDRFLKPSKVKGVSTEQFIKEEQKSMKMHECGVFGYRGLTGHPHAPPSTIVAKIIERISSREDIPEPTYFPGPRSRRNTDIDTC